MRKPRQPLLVYAIMSAAAAAAAWYAALRVNMSGKADDADVGAAVALTVAAVVCWAARSLDRLAAARISRPLGSVEREANHEMQTKLLDTLAKVLDTGPMPRAAAGKRDATRRLRGVDSGDRESPRPGA